METFTGKGDSLHTILADGTSVSKSDARIHVLGSLDELNSHLGLIKSLTQDKTKFESYSQLQCSILQIMAGVAGNSMDSQKLSASFIGASVTLMEGEIKRIEKILEKNTTIVLPGGSFYSAQIDIARTIARRAERWMAAVKEQTGMDEQFASFMNRLSDYLYVNARLADMENGSTPAVFDVAKTIPQIAEKAVAQAITEAPAEVLKKEEPLPPAALKEDEVKQMVRRLDKRMNNTYSTIYIIYITDSEGELIATNSPAKHSVAVHGAQANAKAALHRAKLGEDNAKNPQKSGAPVYIRDQLVGAVGIYGGSEQQNLEKLKIVLEQLR